jgi:GH35 family endo-1,4-beta-xylanase
MIDEAKAHHMQVKLHPIVWGGCYPDWAGKTQAEAEPLIHKHIDDIIKRYGNKVDFMEMNELNSTELLQHQVEGKDGATQSVQSHNGLTDWVGHDGAPRVISTLDDWIRADLKADHSSAKLFENEYVIDQKTLASDQQVAGTASRPDAFGVEMHMFEQNWPALKIEQTLNERGQSGLSDYVSEITVPSGPTQGRTPAQIARGEQGQSEELLALYREALANPNVSGVSLWDFTDKNAWRGGTGGVLDANFKPKEAYRTLQQMITDEYWTRANTSTNSSGSASTRVFKGDYQITVSDTHGLSRTVDVAVQGPTDTVDIKLSD